MQLFILILSCIYSQASISDDKLDPVDKFCGNVEFIAKNAIETRQKGLPLSGVMKVFNDSTTGSLKDIAKSITIAAFKMPIISDEKEKNKLIESFTNQWTVGCYEVKLNQKN